MGLPALFVIRLGGDEILVCMPGATVEQAEKVWQQLMILLRKPT